MKKILIPLAALLISAPVFAAAGAVCDGGVAADKSVTKDSKFIVNDFTQKCSANVFLNYAEGTTEVTVGAASKKGKNNFTGTSTGGGVVASATQCASSGCTAAPTPPTPGGAGAGT